MIRDHTECRGFHAEDCGDVGGRQELYGHLAVLGAKSASSLSAVLIESLPVGRAEKGQLITNPGLGAKPVLGPEVPKVPELIPAHHQRARTLP